MYECLPPRTVIQRSPCAAPARSKNYLPFGEFFAAGYLVHVHVPCAKPQRKSSTYTHPNTTTVAARDVRPLCSSAGAAMVAALHLWWLHEPAGPSYSLEQR